jgi:hypothetical protein
MKGRGCGRKNQEERKKKENKNREENAIHGIGPG